MIRASIARHLGSPGDRSPFASGGLLSPAHEAPAVVRAHASHAMLPLARGGDGDGACLIEPAVRCSHCGYCLSYGH